MRTRQPIGHSTMGAAALQRGGGHAALASFTAPLHAGDRGVAQTVEQIFGLWQRAYQDPLVNMIALQVVHDTPVCDRIRAERLFAWVRDNITFVDDPPGHETVRDARFTLEAGAGDCDDIGGVLIPSLAGCVGINGRLVTVAVDPRRPGEMSHIYAELLIDGEWLPVDTARSNPEFGVAIPSTRYTRAAQIWEPDFSDQNGMSGAMGNQAGYFTEVPIPALSGYGFGDDDDLGVDIFGDDISTAAGQANTTNTVNGISYTYGSSGQLTQIVDPTTGIYNYDPTTGDLVNSIPYANASTITPAAVSQATGLNIPANAAGAPNLSQLSAAQIATLLNAGGTASAAIIKAMNTPNTTLPPGYYLNAFGQVVGPNGAVVGGSSLSSLTSSPILIILLVAGAAILVMKH